MEKDDYLLPHLQDLCRQAERQHRLVCSAFLTLDEQDKALTAMQNKAHFAFFGGTEEAERKVMAFAPLGEEIRLSLPCFHIEVKGKSFGCNLTHRDYLGALMGLGIERDTLGDLFVGEGEAYVMGLPSIAEEILGLSEVRNYHVKVAAIDAKDCPLQPNIVEKRTTVASLRLDALLAEAFNLSREQAKKAILEGLVRVGSQSVNRPDYLPEEGARIALRGKGKIAFLREEGVSKKGKIVVTLGFYS